MSKYNPYEAINAIYNYKGEWDEANKAGDAKGRTNAANAAVKWYQELKDNGYADVADTLSQSNYTQAKYINDYYKSLQDAVNPRNNNTAIQEENENLFGYYNQEYQDLKNTNPFETEEGKAILAKYDLAGLQGRDNQAAVGAATNGGNIDSYAAANALRQQAALVNQGQQTVLSAYQQKLDHARNLLSDMGVNISRVHADNETTKQNDFAIEAEKATISGDVPVSWSQGATNVFLNADGTLKSEYLTEEFDNTGGFSTIIANAEKAGNTNLVNQAKYARALKLFGNYSKYGQYDDGNYYTPTGQKTAEYDLTQQQIESAERIAKDSNETTKSVAETNAQNNLDQIEAQTKGQKEILGESARLGVTEDGTPQDTTDETEWESFYDSFSDKPSVQNFLTDVVKGQVYDKAGSIEGDVLKDTLIELIIANSVNYDIGVEDAKRICNKFGVDTSWLNDYKNRIGKGMKYKD